VVFLKNYRGGNKMKKILLIVLAILGIALYAQKVAIEIAGSDTMLELAQALAEDFSKETGIEINVGGGGSGTGIARLINNTVDIANSSREMKDKEIKLAEEKGVKIYEVKLGIDAIAIIANPKNKVKNLTVDQIAAIYKGEITNWKEVGGDNIPISLYGRQNNSGTYVFFREHILNNKDYSPKMMGMNGNAQIVEAIKNDKGGIGYVGIGYLSDVKGEVKIITVNNMSPKDEKAVLTAKYPIARFLFQYVSDKRLEREEVKKFFQFALTKKGQEIIKKIGFYPLGEKKAKKFNSKVYPLIFKK